MKKRSLCCAWLTLAAAIPLTVPGAPAVSRDPAAVRQVYDAIHEHLDTGGDLMVIANVEGLLQETVSTVLTLLEAIPEDTADAKAVVERLAGFLERQGFYSIQGIGYSAIPRDDGLNNIKMFIAREPGAARMPLWQMMVGGAPAAMTCHAYVPRDAVLVHSGSGDLGALWRMIRQGVGEIGGGGAAAAFEISLKDIAAQIGVSVDDLIASLAPEGLISLQLATDATVALPGPSGEITLPAPSLLLVLAVQQPTVMDTIKRMFAQQLQMPLPEVRVGDATVYNLPIPIPAPIPVQLTLATHGKYLLFGTTSKAVTDALDAAAKGDGLAAASEFTAAFPELGANNGIRFVGRRLGQTLANVRDQLLAQQDEDDLQDIKPALDILKTWLDPTLEATVSAAVYHRRAGIQTVGTGPAGGRQTLGALMVAPLGLLAGIAIPSFVQSREVSMSNACIGNLRQIESGKEQHAMAAGLADGEMAPETEIVKYIRGGMPICPRDGVYTLNPIGTVATCSHPGHQLHGYE